MADRIVATIQRNSREIVVVRRLADGATDFRVVTRGPTGEPYATPRGFRLHTIAQIRALRQALDEIERVLGSSEVTT